MVYGGFDAMCLICQGPGLLVSEDDTVFQGEFSDDWTVNGKVEDTCALAPCLSRSLEISPSQCLIVIKT